MVVLIKIIHLRLNRVVVLIRIIQITSTIYNPISMSCLFVWEFLIEYSGEKKIHKFLLCSMGRL